MEIRQDYPEEYLTGSVNFFGRDFSVTPDVLIPRLETEGLVRRALIILRGMISSNQDTYSTFGHKSTGNTLPSKILLIDIGSGSGIIGTSLADLADEVIFLDISPRALQITEKNFRIHFPHAKARFIISDLLSSLPDLGANDQILFVTNLPYIKDADWAHMSADTHYEPEVALFGGKNTGFELYESLFVQLASLRNRFSCLYEFGFDQRAIAENILLQYPQWQYSFFSDYAGIERFGEIIHVPQ